MGSSQRRIARRLAHCDQASELLKSVTTEQLAETANQMTDRARGLEGTDPFPIVVMEMSLFLTLLDAEIARRMEAEKAPKLWVPD